MREIKLHGKYGNNKVALIDNEEFLKVNKYRWYLQKKGYVVTNIYKKNSSFRSKDHKYITIRLARFLMKPQDKLQVDHINLNKLDNRKCNLRICTSRQNTWNRTTHIKKYKGAYKCTDANRWFSTITANKKAIYLGTYKSETLASKAYNQAALKYHGEFARLNILKEYI